MAEEKNLRDQIPTLIQSWHISVRLHIKAVAGMVSINIRVKGFSFQRSSHGWKIHLNVTCSPYKQDTDAFEEIQLII